MNDPKPNPNSPVQRVSSGYFVPFPAAEPGREISFAELLVALRRAKWSIVSVTLFFVTLSTAAAFLTTPVYRAEVLLLPVVDREARGTLDFGVLATLAGFEMRGGGNSALAIATLESRVLTETYIREQNLLPVLFADHWDPVTGKWTVSDASKIPTLWDASSLFADTIRKVAEDKQTGLVRLSIDWTNPVLAATWANDLVARTNEYLRQQELQRTSANIEYLEGQIATTPIVEIQQSIYRVLEDEFKRSMRAQGTSEFAFQVIDPAVVPEEWDRPQRVLLLTLGLVGGLLAGFLIILVRHMIGGETRSRAEVTGLENS